MCLLAAHKVMAWPSGLAEVVCIPQYATTIMTIDVWAKNLECLLDI
jgi:hypothetical protein